MGVLNEIIEAYQEAFAVPFNVFLLLLMIVMLIFWLSANKWQTPDRVRNRAIFMNPNPTQFLQKHLRSNETLGKFLDFITIQVWFWVFAVTVAIEIFICGLQGENAWRYGIMVLTAWGTSMTIQFLFPVVVPIRWDQFDRELPVVPIRLLKFKQSDNVNGLLYNGLPSNHFGMMLAGALLCFFFFLNDSWSGWIVGILFFLILVTFFSFSVIYLGEHYIWDLIASIFVYAPIMVVIKIILDILVPIT
ncbi:MAG: phosphatase PAP2 family protein [Candidatus Heimdallarchaeota archaeon]|nr:MAG: phosphatase PAP2 family protein [Candidatus Heimdallarchaeota archaeon]